MKALHKEQVLRYIDTSILVFLTLHAASSQLNVVISSIGLGGLVILMTARLALDRNVYKPKNILIYCFLVMVLVYFLSSVFSIDPANSFANSKRVFLFAGFLAPIIFINEMKQLRVILACLLIFSAGVSLYEIAKYWIDFYDKPFSPGQFQRLEYFGYPITNGEIKMLILLLIASLSFSKERFVLSRIWLIVLSIPLFVSLFLTYSRNALLGLFAGLVIIGFVKNKYFLAVLIIMLVILMLVAPVSLRDRILSIADLNSPSIHSRFVMWETGVKIIKDHPILGIGDTDIMPVYKKYKPIEFHGEGSHLHNNFLQILATVGIIGFAAWCLTMVYIFCRQIRIYSLTRKEEVLNSLALASIASMAAFQVSGLTEWNFGDFEFAAVLWFMLALAFLSEKLYTKLNADK